MRRLSGTNATATRCSRWHATNVGRRGSAGAGARGRGCAEGVTEGGQGVARERRARMVGATLGVRSARSEPNTWHAMNSGI